MPEKWECRVENGDVVLVDKPDIQFTVIRSEHRATPGRVWRRRERKVQRAKRRREIRRNVLATMTAAMVLLVAAGAQGVEQGAKMGGGMMLAGMLGFSICSVLIMETGR